MANKNAKQTSKRAASAASKVLRDGRSGKASKTAAASALAQAPKRKKQPAEAPGADLSRVPAPGARPRTGRSTRARPGRRAQPRGRTPATPPRGTGLRAREWSASTGCRTRSRPAPPLRARRGTAGPARTRYPAAQLPPIGMKKPPRGAAWLIGAWPQGPARLYGDAQDGRERRAEELPRAAHLRALAEELDALGGDAAVRVPLPVIYLISPSEMISPGLSASASKLKKTGT